MPTGDFEPRRGTVLFASFHVMSDLLLISLSQSIYSQHRKLHKSAKVPRVGSRDNLTFYSLSSDQFSLVEDM